MMFSQRHNSSNHSNLFQAAKDLSLISIALKKEMKNKSDYESRWSKFDCVNIVPFRVYTFVKSHNVILLHSCPLLSLGKLRYFI
jgi:hypothetical protein